MFPAAQNPKVPGSSPSPATNAIPRSKITVRDLGESDSSSCDYSTVKRRGVFSTIDGESPSILPIPPPTATVDGDDPAGGTDHGAPLRRPGRADEEETAWWHSV
jgi:hypothetical protein